MSGFERDTVGSALLAVGIAAAGFMIGNGFAKARSLDRVVSVKGVAEQEVSADLAIWPLRLEVGGNDLAQAQANLQGSVARIKGFLAGQGLDTTSVSLQDYGVSDAATQQFSDQSRVSTRFVIRQTIVVRSTEPDKVLTASQRVGDLVSAGIVLSSGGEYGNGGPTFVFSGLNALKPKMIATATARAREAAEQFARDAKSDLGGIRTANQGIFEILPRDQAEGITEASQIRKRVRVVSSVEYFLR